MPDRLRHRDAAGRDAEDPLFVVYESELVDGRVRAKSWLLPHSAIRPGPPDAPTPAGPFATHDKLHPLLRSRLQEGNLDERLELIVTFVDQPTVPRFPELVPGEPLDSPRNELERARAAALVRDIQRQRSPRYVQLEAELAAIGSMLDTTIDVRDRFWLINGMLVEAPLRAVEEIAALPSVLSIAPRLSGEAPPAAGPIADGRKKIGSDPYYDLQLLSSTRTALLDSGVNHTHELLVGRIGLRLDCIGGDDDCATGVIDPSDVANHGTGAAAILAANSSHRDPYHGVTAATVDSLRIYYASKDLDREATVRAFQRVPVLGQKVVVAEIQGLGGDRCDLAVEAEQAFASGAIIVAANGNTAGAGTVCAPASSHSVIGVGAYVEETGGQYTNQSYGPTPIDRRVKPEVQGPTGTLTATSVDNVNTTPLNYTSGATPYIGGAAALLRDWNLTQPAGPRDPGQVYAQLVLFGDNVSPFPLDEAGAGSKEGAGRLKLRLDGRSWAGKVALGNGEVVDVELPVPTGFATTLDAAIWWPETWQDGDLHNTVTLTIIDPSGNESGAASTLHSVFERCSHTGVTSAGTWTVRIRGASVQSAAAPQTVYWAAFMPWSAPRRAIRRVVAVLSRPTRRLRSLGGRLRRSTVRRA